MFHFKAHAINVFILFASAYNCQADSLWLNSVNREAGLFCDRVARRKGDIVLLKVDEVIQNREKATTADEHAKKNLFVQKVFDEVHRRGGPKISIPQQYETTGNVALSTDISMQVVEVLPNGNLVLEGICKKRFFDNYQFQTVRGIARQDDISVDNELKSSRLCNVTIEHLTGPSKEGAENNGFFTKLNNFMNL